jgi:tRNA dimethylallyltransferase
MKIGTASPTEEQLQRVKHYFIGTKSITENYSAGQFELDVLELLPQLFAENPVQLMIGGSTLYINAVCNGLDNIPPVREEIREKVLTLYDEQGLDGLQKKLLEVDPAHYKVVDLNNKQRVAHAVEVSLSLGKPYSSMLQHKKKERPFEIIKIGLNLPREILYDRINRRVDQMVTEGLVEEASRLYASRSLNALNTVGYKEIFNHLDGNSDLPTAIEMIKQNSRRYAKRQLTWFNADKSILWFQPTEGEKIIQTIKGLIHS